MKKHFIFFITNLLLVNLCQSQSKFPMVENVTIELKSYGVNPNLFGGARFECSKNINEPDETKFLVYFSAIFKDFSNRKTLNFDDISIVDVENKVRYRPVSVSTFGFTHFYYDSSIELNENIEDAFTKYSQDGIENFDFYVHPRNKIGIKNEKKYRYRIGYDTFKSKSGMKFIFNFPIFKRRNESGNFKIYWKKNLIGEFKIKDGEAIN